jgi:3D (Asp-Asp-Asp) domain-containing protein
VSAIARQSADRRPVSPNTVGVAARFRDFAATAIAAAAALAWAGDASAGPRRPILLRMTATAYCDRRPTKSGVDARSGIVAADPRHLPLGTRIRIVAPGQPHAGTYIVADTGSAISGRDLDIFMPSCARAKAFGKKLVSVHVLKRGSGPKEAREEIGARGR